MANYPATMPSATPATHGEVIDEIRAMALRGTGMHIDYGSGLWYSPELFTGASGQNDAVGDLRLFRCDFPPGTTVDGLAVNVTTAAGGATKELCIYNDDGTSSYPTTLQKSVSVDCSTTGVKTATFAAEPVGGARWLGTLTLTAQATCIGNTGGLRGVGVSTLSATNVVWSGYIQAGQSSAPATFTSTRTPVNGLVRVFYRIG